MTRRADNLVYDNGRLYYIAKGTDDLIEITIDPVSIVSQRKIADVSGDTVVFNTMGDLAINSTGDCFVRFSSRTFASSRRRG